MTKLLRSRLGAKAIQRRIARGIDGVPSFGVDWVDRWVI